MFGEPLSYALFELMVFGLLGVCCWWCLTQRRAYVSAGLELLAFILYGLAFESVAVAAGLYHYAPFTFSLGHTPLVIGLGWAVIGIAVMGFSDSLNMPEWSKPFLDALLALLVDLGMDAVAIRDVYLPHGEGMWSWGLPLDAEWFGVPYANFMAWWLVIFLMSASLRAGRYSYAWFTSSWLARAYPLAALLVALGTFLFCLFSFTSLFNLTFLLALLTMSLAISIVSVQGRHVKLSWRTHTPVLLVPLTFHLYFLCLVLWRHLYQGAVGILLVSLLAFVANEALLLIAQRWSSKRVLA